MTVDLGRDGPLAVHVLPASSASSALEGAVVKAGLGVLLQLLGQVGSGRAAARGERHRSGQHPEETLSPLLIFGKAMISSPFLIVFLNNVMHGK